MYNSIGINRQKELNYLGKRTKIPRISDKTNCCCEHDHFMGNDSYSFSLHGRLHNHNFDIKEDMDKVLCPVREFMMKNKNIIGAVAGVTIITLGTIKIIKEML